jgi:uncharacterized protein affecting Mg2+/Co2+ transport
MEGENPTRRYRSFRPRQAMRGTASTAAANWATVRLYNNSRGAHYLVVRDWIYWTGSGSVFFAYGQGVLGTVVTGGISPILAGEAANPGQLFTNDDATQITGDWGTNNALNQTGWGHDFPFAILPPNWWLAMQGRVQGASINTDFFWEAINADELDYME